MTLHGQLGKFCTKDTRRPKHPAGTSEEQGAKAGPRERPLLSHCLTGRQTTRVTRLTLDTPTLTAGKELAPSPWGRSKATCWLSLLPSGCSRGPDKDVPGFPVWPLINFD